MKYFAIILVACIASSFAATLTDDQRAKLREFKATCIAETGVSPDAIENARKGNIDQGDAKLACFAACLLKKTGSLTNEGTFNEAGFRAQVPADVPKEKVDDIVNKCGSESGANACETGAKLLKCYLENKTFSVLSD
nr:odorant-binding protein 6 [Gregopimpla kuwanae]